MSTDETNLYERFRRGDEEALRELLARHSAQLRSRVASQIPPGLRRRVSSSDVIQETSIVAYAHRADFEDRGEGSFAAWLRAIADHKVREQIRRHNGTSKRAAGREVTRGARPDTAVFRGPQRTPGSVAATAEESRNVRQAMKRLSDDYRQVIQLALEQGLTLREVAERMGRSRDATKKLYGRALLRLRELVDEAPDGP